MKAVLVALALCATAPLLLAEAEQMHIKRQDWVYDQKAQIQKEEAQCQCKADQECVCKKEQCKCVDKPQGEW